jgi:hypothetical protein
MKRSSAFLTGLFLLAALSARANDTAIATCAPNDGYVNLYMSIETFEVAARLRCGTQLELLESQKTYAAQHTQYVRVATEDGKQGYVMRSVLTIYRNTAPANRPVAAKTPIPVTAPPAVAAPPSEMRVPDGTQLEVKLSADLSSDRTTEGAVVNLEVADPLAINGVTVFERGALAHARITQMKKAARWGHDGEIFWAMQNITAVDGTLIPAHFLGEPQNALTNGTPGMLAASGNYGLGEQQSFSLHKGEAAFVPAGQIFRVAVSGDSVVHLAAGQSAPTQSAAAKEIK